MSTTLPPLATDGVVQPPPPLELSVSVEVPPDRPLQAMVTVRASEPVRASARVTGPGVADRVVEGEDLGTVVHVPMVALRERSTYAVSVTTETSDRRTERVELEVTTGAIPDGLIPEATVLFTDGTDRAGVLMIGASLLVEGRGQMVYWAIDREGETVWYYTDPEIPTRANALIEPIGDKTFLLTAGRELRVIDAFGRVLRSVFLDPMDGAPIHHDAQALPDGNFLVLSSEIRALPVPPLGGEMNVVGDLVLELDPDGAVVRRVSLLDVLDPLRYPGRLSTTALGMRGIDWSHANAVTYSEEDDSYVVSLRSQHWIVKIGRSTGEVEWILGEEGDFALEPGGEWFNAQHAPLWADGMLVVYDNGNEREGMSTPFPFTRIVGYTLDEGGWTARQELEWLVPVYTESRGDVDDLGDAWLVTAGAPFMSTQGIVYMLPKGSDDPQWVVRFDTELYRTEWLDSLEVRSAFR